MASLRQLKKRLQKISQEKEGLQRLVDERKSRMMLDCSACDSSHPIRTLTLIQEYWHELPRGCNEGDNWLPGEIMFVCPQTNVHNRLLFNTDDVPWPERKKYENDPQAQFLRQYGHLFKSREEFYKPENGNSEMANVNNYSVDKNRKKFGLVLKRT